MSFPEIRLKLPQWLDETVAGTDTAYPTAQARMEMVVRLSELNIAHKTGGPFAAGIFDEEGRLIAPGANLVERSGCSLWHAEMVAIAMAQSKVGRFDLGNGGREHFELVTSTEPCAMCFGAIHWSGLSRLVCGAREQDARDAGFDEGAKPADWSGELQKRGITVERDVLRQQAAAVLARYAASGGTIYNPPNTHL
jgi:tRNA(Arg) A34 adenosine deaminase TadA